MYRCVFLRAKAYPERDETA